MRDYSNKYRLPIQHRRERYQCSVKKKKKIKKEKWEKNFFVWRGFDQRTFRSEGHLWFLKPTETPHADEWWLFCLLSGHRRNALCPVSISRNKMRDYSNKYRLPIQHRRERYQCSVKKKKNRRKNGKKFFCVKETRTADLWVAHPWIKEPTGTTSRWRVVIVLPFIRALAVSLHLIFKGCVQVSDFLSNTKDNQKWFSPKIIIDLYWTRLNLWMYKVANVDWSLAQFLCILQQVLSKFLPRLYDNELAGRVRTPQLLKRQQLHTSCDKNFTI